MSGFFLVRSCVLLSVVRGLWARGKWVVAGGLGALAAFADAQGIAVRCCSLLAWSAALLLFWFVGPAVRALGGFFGPVVDRSWVLCTWRHSRAAGFLSSTFSSRCSHSRVSCSHSGWLFHLLRVAAVEFCFAFFALSPSFSAAVHFLLAMSCLLGSARAHGCFLNRCGVNNCCCAYIIRGYW